jgi:hypothetical protein
MANTADTQALQLSIGGAQVHLQNVKLREDVTIDEIHIEGGVIQIEAGREYAEPAAIEAGESQFRIMMSEPNINRVLASAEGDDALVRNLRIALLSGKARVTGQIVKSVIHLPFTVEAVPVIENGVRVRLDFQGARLGISLPGPVVDVIEQIINNNNKIPLDLSRLPFPVLLDEIRCEPGRLSVSGRARLSWPPASTVITAAPFTVSELPPDNTPTLLPNEEPTPAPSSPDLRLES